MKNIQDQKPGEGYKEGTGCLTFLGEVLDDVTIGIIVVVIILVILAGVFGIL